jgi:hypothetical protein
LLDVRHLDERPENNDPQNLVLCRNGCHKDIHREPPPLAA